MNSRVVKLGVISIFDFSGWQLAHSQNVVGGFVNLYANDFLSFIRIVLVSYRRIFFPFWVFFA